MTQEEVRTYIKESAEVHEFTAEVARIISCIPQIPEFSNKKLTVEDVSKNDRIYYSIYQSRDCPWMASDWDSCP